MLDYVAFPEQRQNKIRQLLQDEGRVVCTTLAREMQVSEHTIRRDLNELAQEGVCRRVHGGAVSMLEEKGTFEQRTTQNQDEKIKIAKACNKLVKQNTCIFIDSGSTNLEIARYLPSELSLTVVTHSPAIALELMKKPLCEVILIGGKLNRQVGASIDISAGNQINQIHFDQCFIGGCALDPQMGVSIFDYEESKFKKILFERSNQVIMGVTADKLPGVARYKIANCEQISILVMTTELNKQTTDLFTNMAIKIAQA
ncbi:DeoR/GlpR family DNA-binding transcription regulator [Providencia rettgeri]|uniref:DeoR/GlpR family DNA-binding transcription regulator n=1 Tax=Providencia rettgeri TaxID=587 RepID=UPI0018C599BC|nr:DeoR/GlpR family DNA-binding transcription regulator [Providencia rettgeri]MBG5899331.1 DeoR/GlpR transcriptional regulator [Providencia rettgeri]MBQ0398621.1 DeoR/GlpR transcriptional regulator [Providencia rettgeri]